MPRGRPSPLLDEDFFREIVQYVEVGNYVNVACAAMGITEKTYYLWLGNGRKLDEYLDGRPEGDDVRERMLKGENVVGFSVLQCCELRFMYAITRANARSEAFAVAMVRKHMPDQWTAAMTFLERRFPGRWKRREQLDIGDAGPQTGIDETLLLSDPSAVKLIHDALELVSKPEELIESTVVEEATVTLTPVSPRPATPAQDDEKPPTDSSVRGS